MPNESCPKCGGIHTNLAGWQRDPGQRWCEGVDHHPKSKELFDFIDEQDFKVNGDFFCWKKGGDGDNGEQLMYLMDMYFERG